MLNDLTQQHINWLVKTALVSQARLLIGTITNVFRQDLENFESSSAVVSSVKKSWGVRREMGTALDRVERSTNPIEEIIAKDIRELKEREEELIRLREQGNTEDEEEEVKEEAVIEPEEPILELEPPVKLITTSNLRLNETKPINNDR